MADTDQRALRAAITSGVFDPVYLLHGENDFLKDAAVRGIVERAVEPGLRDFNVDVRRGPEVDAQTLHSLLATLPMMAPRRVLVVRDVGGLRKPARVVLNRYLKNPASETILVLVTTGSSGTSAADSELERTTTAVEFPMLSEGRIPKWIEQRVGGESGARISAGAVGLLVEAVGTDLPQLAVEIDKLVSYAGGAEIDEAAVSAVVGISRGTTVGDLLDAIGRREVTRALELLPHVLSLPKTSAVTLVMALATQTLALAWGRVLRDEGRSSSEVGREYFQLLKESGAMTSRPWGEAVKAWSRALDEWTIGELDRALEALLVADIALKESRVSSDEQILSTLILTMCGPR
jgi:DNA polymerase-3 subunit delta